MKKIIVFLTVLGFLIGFPDSSFAADQNLAVFTIGSNSYTVNGQTKTMDVSPYLSGGRTYLPLRYTAEAVGLSSDNITWDDSSRTASINGNGINLSLTLGSQELILNGSPRTMDVEPKLMNGRIMLPVRWVAEAMNIAINWNSDTQTITFGQANNDTKSKIKAEDIIWVYQSDSTPCKLSLQRGGKIKVISGDCSGITWGMVNDSITFYQGNQAICYFSTIMTIGDRLFLMGTSELDKNITCILREAG